MNPRDTARLQRYQGQGERVETTAFLCLIMSDRPSGRVKFACSPMFSLRRNEVDFRGFPFSILGIFDFVRDKYVINTWLLFTRRKLKGDKSKDVCSFETRSIRLRYRSLPEGDELIKCEET